MKEIQTFGQVKGDKIHYTKVAEFKKLVFDTFKPDERFLVIYRKIYRKRSLSQNNYWYGCLIECALQAYEEYNGHQLGVEFTNHQTGEVFHIALPHVEQVKMMHEMLLKVCNLDEEGNVRRSHDNSTTQQMEMQQSAIDYIKFAWNYTVPLPSEQSEIDLK